MSKVTTAILSVLAAVPVGIAFADRIGSFARVEGKSMVPSLNADSDAEDWVWLNKYHIHHKHDYQRGDVVTLRNPNDPDSILVKRIKALPGDWIRVQGSDLPLVRVPAGRCWVEGDNRHNSLDSRAFGTVPLALIDSKVSGIIWPPRHWGKIPSLTDGLEQQ